MKNYNILIIGGTGYIGNIIKQYILKYYQLYNNIICLNSIQFNTSNILNINKYIKFIIINKINLIIDLARDNKLQLVTFYFFIKKLPINCEYMHLSSYSLIDSKIYATSNDDKIDKYVSIQIDKILKKIHKKFYSFITPLITEDDININIRYKKELKTNYILYCTKDIFMKFIINIIIKHNYGIHIIPSKKFFI